MSSDPYRYFRVEARDLVEKLSQGILDLEKGRGDQDLVPRLLRYAHTLKGAARVVKQARIAELSHSMEDLLAPYRDGQNAVPSSEFGPLLSQVDAIAAQLGTLDVPPAGELPPAVRTGSSEEHFENLRVDASEMDALLRAIADVRVHLSSLGQQAATIRLVSQLASGLAADVQRCGVPGRGVRGAPWEDMVGVVEEIDSSLKAAHRAIGMSLARTERQWGRLYEQASEMRLVPASSLFGTLERSVRDAASEVGKEVDFVATGGDARLDAHVLGLLRNALIHLVRNAVAHGIEQPSERMAVGKSAAGRIEVRVQRRADQAVFTCRDDGRGIELDQVRQALLARRLVAPTEARDLTSETALTMLLRGGISTTQRITELSGRGIGLDVVRETVARLQGSTIARTERGRGTTIEISVPVSIESVEVLHVEAGGIMLAIPFQAVRRAVRLRESDVARSAERDSIVCEGQVVPLLSLAAVFHRERGFLRRGQSFTALVLDTGSGAAAVSVDHLRGRERVVVRSLPDEFGPVPSMMGAFFDSEGDPQLVLNPAGVIQAASGGTSAAPIVPPAQKPRLLVIDDSLTTRMLEQGILETAGYEVDTAASGEEALQKARERPYGVFLVDVEMPGMNGFEFLETARTDPRLGQVPSIMITSRDSAEDRDRGDRLGVWAYIVKSRFEEEVLLRTIRELVG